MAASRSVSAERTGRRMGFWPALVRVLQNRLVEGRRVARLFDDQAFRRIEDAIAAGESRHRGEIRFALEQDLTVDDAMRTAAAREHALAAFARHGVWDTEENSGVLIFLQWPLHGVEIVADRGVSRLVPEGVWTGAIERIARACRDGRPVNGVIEAIGLIDEALADVMPAAGDDRDELSNRPIRL
ncbi:MAG: TPM domain-containing protein [Burkholderiaceae bacterium]